MARSRASGKVPIPPNPKHGPTTATGSPTCDAKERRTTANHGGRRSGLSALRFTAEVGECCFGLARAAVPGRSFRAIQAVCSRAHGTVRGKRPAWRRYNNDRGRAMNRLLLVGALFAAL